jgi:hypothetical protein
MFEQPQSTLKRGQVQSFDHGVGGDLTQSAGITTRTLRGNAHARNRGYPNNEHTGNALNGSYQAFYKSSMDSRIMASHPSNDLEMGMREPFCPDNKTVPSPQQMQSKNDTRSITKRKGKMQHPSRFDHTGADLPGLSPLISSDGGTDATKPYHCTACRKSFKDVYGWKRHESGVHGYNDTEWVCMLDGTTTQGTTCIFCSEIVNDIHHFDTHDIHKCLNKAICDRTFARKDLLKQHVQQVHLAATEKLVLKAFQVPKAWSQPVDPMRINPAAVWCGFCLDTCPSVTERMKHVAEHFQDGYDMQDWIPVTTIS